MRVLLGACAHTAQIRSPVCYFAWGSLIPANRFVERSFGTDASVSYVGHSPGAVLKPLVERGPEPLQPSHAANPWAGH